MSSYSLEIEKPMRGLILDVDGVCLDSFPHQFRWLRFLCGEYGKEFPYPEPDDAFKDAYNQRLKERKMPGLYYWFGIDFEKEQTRIWELYTKYNAEHPLAFHDGMPDVIREIHSRSRPSRNRPVGLRLALNTTRSKEIIEPAFRQAGVYDLLDTVTSASDYATTIGNAVAKEHGIDPMDATALRKRLSADNLSQIEKPSGFSVALTIERLCVHHTQIVGIEDDIKGGGAYEQVLLPYGIADVPFALVSWGFESKHRLIERFPKAPILDTPAQLVELVGDCGGFS